MTYLDKRKDRIAIAALEVFKEKGFIQASMKDIMEVANVSRGGLYGHFENIEDVFIHALKLDDEKSQEILEHANFNFESWVYRIMESNLDLVRAKSEFFLQNSDVDYPYLKERKQILIDNLTSHFETYNLDLDTHDLAHFTLSSIDGILLSSHFDKVRLNKNTEIFIHVMNALIKEGDVYV